MAVGIDGMLVNVQLSIKRSLNIKKVFIYKFDNFYYEGHSTEKKINQIFSDSKDYDETDLIGQVDLIFIDGAHTKSYVESDTNKALRMLSPQGVIVWHDYKLDAPDVFHYLNELSRTIEMVHIKDTDMVIYRKQSI